MSTFHSFLESNTAIAIVIAAMLLAAFANSFVLDDAFISFRYAHNLVYAHELTWNPGSGERLEGYTNFLWTILMAAPIALGIDPVPASKCLGLLFALGTLLVTWRLAMSVLLSRRAATLTIILLGTNYTFSAFATGGLETQMQTFLVVSGACLAFAAERHGAAVIGRYAALSGVCAAALLTRLDSTIPFAVFYVYLLWSLIERASPAGRRAAAGASLVIPAMLVVGAWLVWKHAYYGALLPNSYYARADALSFKILKEGSFYLFEFLLSYGLLPFVFLAIFSLKGLLAKREMRVFACAIVLWFLYAVTVGGDFMEFRFLVPALPFAFIVITALIEGLAETRVRMALIAMILLCSLFHAASFPGARGIEPVRKMRDYVGEKNGNWREVGIALGELFPACEGHVVIATTAAGAIPYYSHLPTVDMFGINDRWVARNGFIVGMHPGHRRAATFQYLIDRGVNLVIGHPLIEVVDSEPPRASYSTRNLEDFMIQGIRGAQIPETAKILDVPIDSSHTVAVLYLTRSDYVDRIVREKRLNARGIIR
jgi:arabinofuranosyltransferase